MTCSCSAAITVVTRRRYRKDRMSLAKKSNCVMSELCCYDLTNICSLPPVAILAPRAVREETEFGRGRGPRARRAAMPSKRSRRGECSLSGRCLVLRYAKRLVSNPGLFCKGVVRQGEANIYIYIYIYTHIHLYTYAYIYIYMYVYIEREIDR